jgi:predicted lipoprotein with Yx(FWY)xxD motif
MKELLMFRSLIPLSLLVAVFVAACSGSAGTSPAPATPAPVTAAPPTAAPASLAATGPTVSAASAGFFVGPNGKTLYAFDKDTADKSNCSGQCASNWPSLTVSSATAITLGTGLTSADFATITGTSGSLQVTYNHVPLYYFSGDSAPGDKNGDGVGGIWHLATAATGAPSASTAPSAAPTAAASPAAPASPTAPCYDANGYKITCP